MGTAGRTSRLCGSPTSRARLSALRSAARAPAYRGARGVPGTHPTTKTAVHLPFLSFLIPASLPKI